jgi:hypothetical protein
MLTGSGLFGDPDSIERLTEVLLGANGYISAGRIAQEVGDQVDSAVAQLVPNEWDGRAAHAFAERLRDGDVHNLRALSEAASALGVLLTNLAREIRAANRRGEYAKGIANAAGFDIDTSGRLSSDLLHSLEHSIEQLVPGTLDTHAMVSACDEMVAARRIAEDAWSAAGHALESVRVPTIGKGTVQEAESWGFRYAPVPGNVPARGKGNVATGLPPTQPRPDKDTERQRVDGIRFVHEHCEQIVQVAKHYRVPPEAIAGAVLWEAVEDPHVLPPGPRGQVEELAERGPGAGKVHWYELGRPTAAEQAEHDGKIPGVLPAALGLAQRRFRVTDPDWAIRYIGAILRDDADRYEEATRKRGNAIDISTNIGVLLTFYEGVDGGPEGAAARDDLNQGPLPGNDMGPWVMEHLPWVSEQLTCLG